MNKLILTCAFAIIARVNTNSVQVFLMALGIVGTIACIYAL